MPNRILQKQRNDPLKTKEETCRRNEEDTAAMTTFEAAKEEESMGGGGATTAERRGGGDSSVARGSGDAELITRAKEQRDRTRWLEEEQQEKRMRTNIHCNVIGRMYDVARMIRRDSAAPGRWARSQT